MRMKNEHPLYPLLFEEVFKRKIWGGDQIKQRLGKKDAPTKCGECWEIADIPEFSSKLKNGKLAGKSLAELLTEYKREILGSEIYFKFNRFPLIIKFLNPVERLSLQVHPDREYVAKNNLNGTKTEAWYIIDAQPGAMAIKGHLPGIKKDELRKTLEEDTIDDHINHIKIKTGDVVFIPPGTIHSAYGDALFYEIQEASDITLRLTDWGRKDFDGKARKVHLDKALDAVNFENIGVGKMKPSSLPGFKYSRKSLIRCERFNADIITLGPGKKIAEEIKGDRFRLITIVDGRGAFITADKKSHNFQKGQTFLLPACLGMVKIAANRDTQIICAQV